MKNIMLTKEEINSFKTVGERIDAKMREKGIKSIAELDRIIKEKRGNSPDRTIYSKLKKPTDPEQGYYNLSAENLYVIADALDVTTDYLLTGNEFVSPLSDDVDISKLGLSVKSVKNLIKIKECADNFDPEKIRSTSKYYRNPYNKELDMLNWILEHINVNEGEDTCNMDFLMSLYHLVMTRFDGYRGGMTQLMLDHLKLSTYDALHDYHDALFRVNNPITYESDEITEHEKEKALERLGECRERYIREEEQNRKMRSIISDFIDDSTVSIMDSVTYDQIRMPLGDPQTSIKEHISAIITNWRKEYTKIYDGMKKKQTDEYNVWLESVKDIPWPGDPDFEYPENDENEEVPEDVKYREPYHRALSESEMKLSMLLDFLEDNGLSLTHIGDDGKISVSEDLSDAQRNAILKKAAREEVGLLLREDGSVVYDENTAGSTYDRLKTIYEEKILPRWLQMELRDNHKGDATYLGYVTKENMSDYSRKEIERIKKEFEKKGGTYTVENGYLHIKYKEEE